MSKSDNLELYISPDEERDLRHSMEVIYGPLTDDEFDELAYCCHATVQEWSEDEADAIEKEFNDISAEKESDDDAMHYGTPRHSGRYPYGSGDDPYQHNASFMSSYNAMKEQGLSDATIAKNMGFDSVDSLTLKISENAGANDISKVAKSGSTTTVAASATRQPNEFLTSYYGYKKSGMTESQIVKEMGLKSTSQLRARVSIESNNDRREKVQRATELAQQVNDKGKNLGATEIARAMSEEWGEKISESTVRGYLKPEATRRTSSMDVIGETLKANVAEKSYIDVGVGTELQLGVSRTQMKNAIEKLKENEGYNTYFLKTQQLGTGKNTSIMVLTAPDTTYSELFKNREKVQQIEPHVYDPNDGSFVKINPPVSLDSSRVKIHYADEKSDDDGTYGVQRDGVIQIRRGLNDISLGDAQYAQVRIAVDGTHYLKGMAMYKDDMPDGVDVIFNTNKTSDVPASKVFKSLKLNEKGELDAHSFGAEIKRQGEYIDENGNKKQSCINIVNSEGDWDSWSPSIASQMLSKQTPALAKKQLNLAYLDKKNDFEEIMNLTNAEVKRSMLTDFAENCDSSAVKLKAAALPRQASKVILPIPSLKDNEIYAPSFKDGETVVLIRYPHGGRFEIPELRVNIRNAEANKVMHNATDAVGINSKVAERLSGADFDGDTVLVIPNNDHSIKTQSPLKELVNFDSKSYKFTDAQCAKAGNDILKKPIKESDSKDVKNMKTRIANGYSPTEEDIHDIGESALTIKSQTKQTEMGKVSNLITDMTLHQAPPDELARAVKHSMVVIDSEKHHLDYQKSYVDNGIAELKKKYQGSENGGASTLISRAKGEARVDLRKEWTLNRNSIDELGNKIYKTAEDKDLYYTVPKTKKDGTVVNETRTRQTKTTKMAEALDANELSSGTDMEKLYASYANACKDLARQARLAAVDISTTPRNPSASVQYAKEVSSLKSQLNRALKNAPYERQAQLVANYIYKSKLDANPDMSKDQKKKAKSIALNEARARVGASKKQIDISEKEWEAIQAGAVSSTVLRKILQNADSDTVRKLATPRESVVISDTKKAMARNLASSGASLNEIAERLGISASSVSNILKES